MEFPTLGQHCSESTCKQLDFLPMKCDACADTFCKNHITYATHGCKASYKKDIQVPVCPLCNKLIPVDRGEQPDLKVGQHMDTDCQSDPAKEKRKAYTNRCSKKSCKQKELVPMICASCHKNFCIKHRFTGDHDCRGFQDSGRGISKAGASAINRFTGQQANAAHPGNNRKKVNAGSAQSGAARAAAPQGSQQAAMPAGLTEDEALSMAIQASLSATDIPASKPVSQNQQQEDEDRDLAAALQASEQEQQPANRRRRQPISACTTS